MITFMLVASLILFGVAVGIALYRIIAGPTLPDRITAMDFIGVNLISVIGVISVLFNTLAFLEAILVMAILLFISTVAFARYIERGVIIERKRDR
ncbi:Na(+)/H(+) antiporter subunit F1 [Lentibacillus sp. CBA3610]|uniref:Na(+)/H(+) antiporter subunit F1 n=1 Tax=Lentibacillus sp. CBA3610 TaxID=2518176 RepID=UPI00159611A7|nr:Na(+)/H(+) antiporter subunit F1 [Lentibacillus sp. CBA3610]QKY70661.1 Na(+)/H(+) antiporter subunit F1 [Lentibacillus sp. CBA3610]